MMLSKLSQKNYFSPQTLQIILVQSLNSFSIQFWYKNYIFFIFLVSSLRKKREKMLNSNNRETKSRLTPISTTKMVNFSVKMFHLVREFNLDVFSPLNLFKNKI